MKESLTTPGALLRLFPRFGIRRVVSVIPPETKRYAGLAFNFYICLFLLSELK